MFRIEVNAIDAANPPRCSRWPPAGRAAAAGAAPADRSAAGARRICAPPRTRSSTATAGSIATTSIVRIPVADAMKLTLQRGPAARDSRPRPPRAPTQATQSNTGRRAASEGFSPAAAALSIVAASLIATPCRPDDRRAGGRILARAGLAVAEHAPAASRDRLRSEHRRAAAARCRSSATKTGKTVTLGSFYGEKPVVLALRVLHLPDALHAGAERDDGDHQHAVARRGQGFRAGAGQLRSA